MNRVNILKSATLRGLTLTLAIAGLVLVGGASTAFAAANSSPQSCTPWAAGSGNGANVIQMQCSFHNVTDTFTDVIPCLNLPANITQTYNGTFHVNELTSGAGAGTFWATGTETGSVVAVPLDSSAPTYTGHFTVWFGDNNNLHNGSETSTFTVVLTGSDGSSITFHDVAHISVSATGITTSFDKPTCA